MASAMDIVKGCYKSPLVRKVLLTWGLFLGAIYFAREMEAASQEFDAQNAVEAGVGQAAAAVS